MPVQRLARAAALWQPCCARAAFIAWTIAPLLVQSGHGKRGKVADIQLHVFWRQKDGIIPGAGCRDTS